MNTTALTADPAQYPSRYVEACAALFRCDQVDECAEWANRAAAMASYARQSQDTRLLEMANRIRARAVRRCGELLETIPSQQGVKTSAGREASRENAAKRAGLSTCRQMTAIQIARVPARAFEQLVEASPPATLTHLAGLGVRGTWPTIGKARMAAAKRVRKLADFCETSKAENFRDVVDAHDVRRILAWCTAFLEK